MHIEICSAVNQGHVSCFLADELGNRVEPEYIQCHENDPNSRQDETIMLPNGENIVLQRVFLNKTGYVVIEIDSEQGICISQPIPFSVNEEVLLCAPEGTTIECSVVEFNCFASINCDNNTFTSLDLNLRFCQDIKVTYDVTVELPVRNCLPRENINFENGCQVSRIEQEVTGQLPIESQQFELACLSVPKIYDWIINDTTVDLFRSANSIEFDCSPCQVHLFVPAVIVCERTIQGVVECGGAVVQGVEVTLESDSDLVNFEDTTVVTDEFGHFETTVTIPDGTDPTEVTITATTTVDGQTISTTLPTIVRCTIEGCDIFLFSTETIDCAGALNGRVRCGNQLIEGAVVEFTSVPDILTFDPNPDTTDASGEFASGITVPPGTDPTAVTIIASTTVNGEDLEATFDTVVSCDDTDCFLTLNVPADIECEGVITGNISCNGDPVDNIAVTLSSFPTLYNFTPNPVFTDSNGDFSTTITIPPNTTLTSTVITAEALVNGEILHAHVGSSVFCPPEECPCKFRLGIQGNRADATVNVTRNGIPNILTGTINVTAIQCFTAGPNCNPNVDNFNVSFGADGDTINLILGRRIEIECDGNQYARVYGTARETGNYFNDGIFEVTIEVTISATNIGTWTINATDLHGNTFSTTFTAPMSPISFIGECEDTFTL